MRAPASLWAALGAAAALWGLLGCAAAHAATCPDGSRPDAEGRCPQRSTEIDFDEVQIDGTVARPSLQLITDRPEVRYPCDDLQAPGLIDEWETCLVNYYGSVDVPRVAHDLATRFVERRTCPKDDTDVSLLEEIARTYARHPRQEDLTELQGVPLFPESTAVEPQLPIICGFNVSQRRWFPPRTFYCDGGACYPQADTGSKDRIRYVPITNAPGLMEVRSNDPTVRSIADGGSFGYLRIIPLGGRVYLATSGGMYGDIYYLGLILVPDEERYLARACDMEEQARSTRLFRRWLHQFRAQTLLQKAEALVRVRSLSAQLARLVGAGDPTEVESLRREAKVQISVLNGDSTGMPVEVPACARYESTFPRAYARRLEAKAQRAAPR